jgi:hypothetical protein
MAAFVGILIGKDFGRGPLDRWLFMLLATAIVLGAVWAGIERLQAEPAEPDTAA